MAKGDGVRWRAQADGVGLTLTVHDPLQPPAPEDLQVGLQRLQGLPVVDDGFTRQQVGNNVVAQDQGLRLLLVQDNWSAGGEPGLLGEPGL